jgi:hypothetical protein
VFVSRAVVEILVASHSSRLTKYHQESGKHASILVAAEFLPAMIYSDRHRIRIGAENLTNFAARWNEPWSMEY